jgi:hypothetical protein
VPPDLGSLIGQPAFEQARGILMELCGYTAAEALAAMGEIERVTGRSAEDVVVVLAEVPTRDWLRNLGLAGF